MVFVRIVQGASLIVFCLCAYKIIKAAWGFTFIEESLPIAPVKLSRREYLNLFWLVFGLYFVTMLTVIICGIVKYGGMYPTPLSVYSLLRDTFTKGDALHYMFIAKYGYVTEGLAKNWIAFYPLFPLVVRIVREVVRSYYISSVIVNFGFIYLTAIFLYKLLAAETYSRTFAFRGVLLLIAAPQALFYVAPYGEAMFFALTLISIYNIRRGNFLAGAFFGFLSALTRNVGIIVAAIFVLEYLNQNLTTIKLEGSWIPHITKSVAMTLLILLGQVCYMGLNYVVFGSPTAYSTFQMEYWEQGVGNFVSTIGYLLSYIPQPEKMEWILNLPSIGAFFFYLFWLYKKGDKIRPSYGVYALCYFFIVFAPTRLLSGLRYSMVAFPLYLMMCDIDEKWYYALITGFGFWWVYFTVAFARGFYIF
ncbi:MAG: hypothetical protein IJR47_03930 [Clostridia bacterium]|nr:hypothetical protein [Clostridia bacterium]